MQLSGFISDGKEPRAPRARKGRKSEEERRQNYSTVEFRSTPRRHEIKTVASRGELSSRIEEEEEYVEEYRVGRTDTCK